MVNGGKAFVVDIHMVLRSDSLNCYFVHHSNSSLQRKGICFVGDFSTYYIIIDL